MVRVHYFAVMVSGMQFLKLYWWISSIYLRKALTKEKREEKDVNDLFIAVFSFVSAFLKYLLEIYKNIFFKSACLYPL